MSKSESKLHFCEDCTMASIREQEFPGYRHRCLTKCKKYEEYGKVCECGDDHFEVVLDGI